jgi:predicted amidophosphoribosyltransferase
MKAADDSASGKPVDDRHWTAFWMKNDILHELNCPNCLAPLDVRDHGRHVTCAACDSQFMLTGRFCPRCGDYSTEENAVCGQCSYPLQRLCPKCQTANWSGAEYCVQCGTAMDILELITRRHAESVNGHREEQRARMKKVKAQEELAAQERMGRLLEEEEARQIALRAQLAQIQRRERRTLWILYAIGAFFILTFLLLLAGSFLSG